MGYKWGTKWGTKWGAEVNLLVKDRDTGFVCTPNGVQMGYKMGYKMGCRGEYVS